MMVHYGLMHWEPVGLVAVAVSGQGVVSIDLGIEDEDHIAAALCARLGLEMVPGDEETRPARDQLSEYFAGKRRSFDLAVDIGSLTRFQQQVLEIVREIPYGQTLTYGEVAARAGRPNAARAVGQAVARNPIPIMIPCHRVVGASGALGGYSAPGGTQIKRILLGLEDRTVV